MGTSDLETVATEGLETETARALVADLLVAVGARGDDPRLQETRDRLARLVADLERAWINLRRLEHGTPFLN